MYEGLAFILYPGLTLLDLVGPLQVLNKFITSEGVSTGIDMALYLVSKLTEESIAKCAIGVRVRSGATFWANKLG